MLRFEPESLQVELAESQKAIPKGVELDFIDLNDPEFDAKAEKDEVVTEDSEMGVFVPGCLDWGTITVLSFIDFVDAYHIGKLVDKTWVRTKYMSYFLVEPSDYRSAAVIYGDTAPDFSLGQEEFVIDEREYSVWMKSGLTPFAAVVLRDLEYSEHSPPYDERSQLVVVDHEKDAPDDAIEKIARSFLFEIANAADLTFSITQFSEYKESWDDIDLPLIESTTDAEQTLRLRPIDLTRGMRGAQRLYLQAAEASELIGRIVGLTKVFEYVAPTVIRREFHASLRSRLMAPGALAPNAEYLDELIELTRGFGSLERKDQELIKQTIQHCCDSITLAKLAPDYLPKLHKIKAGSSSADRKSALGDLAARVYATRNSIVHAKANYTPTGLEAPEDRIEELIPVMREAAKQAIAWLALVRPEERVIGDDKD